jgi:hypothetical protein
MAHAASLLISNQPYISLASEDEKQIADCMLKFMPICICIIHYKNPEYSRLALQYGGIHRRGAFVVFVVAITTPSQNA